jgi:hypothetical protein
VFAGATLPFGRSECEYSGVALLTLLKGIAKPVADVIGGEKMAGFAHDGSVVDGFSALHDSGTGGVSRTFIDLGLLFSTQNLD